MQIVKIVTVSLYTMLILGEIILFRKSFIDLYYQLIHKAKMRDELRSSSESDELLTELNNMLYITLGMEGDNAGYLFLFASLGLGVLAFIFLTAIFSVRLGLFGLIAVSLMPYAVIRTRLQNFRVDISREGEILLTELLNNYRIYHYNMREAIEQTAISIEEAPHSKKMLLNLAKELTSASSNAETSAAIEKFRYSIATSWGDMLAANIEFGHIEGIKVTEALKDLVDNIIKARKALEQNKRENNESKIMLKVLFPGMCVLTYVGAVKFFGFTPQKFFSYQFGTATGVGWTIGLIATYIVSMLISAFLTRQKMDL